MFLLLIEFEYTFKNLIDKVAIKISQIPTHTSRTDFRRGFDMA